MHKHHNSHTINKFIQMKKYIRNVFIDILIISLKSVFCFGQDNLGLQPYNVLVNSPNTASLGVYGDIPVGNYTGTPNIDIPIFEINLNGMKIPISISYHASGIRVQQEASSIGLGWALNAGGQIIKNIRDEEDHEVTMLDEGVVHGYYNAKALFNQYIDEGSPFPDLTVTGDSAIDVVECVNFINTMLGSDTEPDLYSYNFCGHIGKMITGAEEYQPVGHGDAKKGLLLSPKEYLDFSFKNNSWVAKDITGYTYYFKTFETTAMEFGSYGSLPNEFLNSTFSMSSHESIKSTIRNQGNGIFFVSAWLLDSIVSPYNSKVSFEYVKEFVEMPLSMTENANYLTGVTGVAPAEYHPDLYPKRTYIMSFSTILQTVLKKITWDGGEIIFNTTGRNDLISTGTNVVQKISGIQVYNKGGVLIRDFVLEHTYHGNQSSLSPGYEHRLLLTKITENKSDATYSFAYNMGALPSKNSLNTDIWGFYNGHKGIPSFLNSEYKLYTVPSAKIKNDLTGGYISITGTNKNVDPLSLLHGMLETITYPTGGKSFFEFEPHRVSDPQKIIPTPNEYLNYEYQDVAGISYSLSATPHNRYVSTLYFPFELNENCSHARLLINHSPLLLEPHPDFDLYEPFLRISIQKLENGVYNNIPFNLDGPVPRQITGYDVEIFPNGNTETLGITAALTSDQYRLAVTKDDFISENFFFSVGLKVYMKVESEEEENTNMVGGVRIRKITHIIDDKTETTEYKYLSADGSKSSGRLMSTPLFFAYIVQRVESRSPVTVDYRLERHYVRFSSNPFQVQAYTAQGSHVGYDDVQVYMHKEEGYVNYSYKNFAGITQTLNHIKLPIIEPAFNGLLTRISYYNADLELVKKETYTYDHLMGERKYYAFAKDKEQLLGNDFWNPLDLHNAIICYNIPSFITRLNEKRTADYFSTGTGIVETISYIYDSNYFLPISTQTISSQVKNIKEITKYPFDYSDAVNVEMVGKSLLGLPIEKISLVDDKVVASNKMVYKDTLNMYLPVKIFAFRSNVPVNISNYESGYVEEVILSNYNKKGKPGLVKKFDNTKIIHLWGYQNQYLITKAENASYTDIACTSFEDDCSGSNWIVGSTSRNTGDARTGEKSYNLGSGQITKTGLSVNDTYIVSYWSRSGTVSISNSSGSVKTGRTAGGWTHYEHTIIPSTATIVLSGNSIIDELRLYPLDALITTYTYRSLVGMTSETDPSGRTLFYEYDGFGRLQYVRDDNGKIIEEYHYHYRDQ